MKKRSTTYRLNKVDYSIFIIFSIAAAAMLYLFYRDLNSFTIKQSEEPVAKIYFKKNTAQRRFIDNDIWEILTDSSDIYDGDRIRTSKNSEAYTEFLDTGIQIQLHEKSMVQIFKNKKQRSIDFIGGEIQVTNTSPEEKLVIQSGKKEISVSQESEVILALPEEEDSVIVEVVQGQVEIIDHSEERTSKTEAEPLVISAGEVMSVAAEAKPEVEAVLPFVPTEPVTTGVEKTVEEPLVYFMRSDWWDSKKLTMNHNYAYNIRASDVTEKRKMIPAGAVVKIEISGISDKDVREFAIQIPTGEAVWERAHPWFAIIPNEGRGIIADQPFTAEKIFILDKKVVNTDLSYINIAYGYDVLDEPIFLKDFVMKLSVVALTSEDYLQNVERGKQVVLEYNNCAPRKEIWNETTGEFNYKIDLSPADLFGEAVQFPVGTKFKVTLSGICNTDQKCHTELYDSHLDEWILVTDSGNDPDPYGFIPEVVPAGKYFNYTKNFECYSPVPNTTYSRFIFVCDPEDRSITPVFDILKITIEIL